MSKNIWESGKIEQTEQVGLLGERGEGPWKRAKEHKMPQNWKKSRLSLTPYGLATCNFLFSDVGVIACGIYSVNAVFTGIGFCDIQYNIP